MDPLGNKKALFHGMKFCYFDQHMNSWGTEQFCCSYFRSLQPLLCMASAFLLLQDFGGFDAPERGPHTNVFGLRVYR